MNPDSDPSTPTTAAIRRWSTDAVPAGQRLDYWIGAICEGFLEMEATSPSAARFHSSLMSARLGGIGVNRVRGSAQDVFRSAGAIAKSGENHYYLLSKPDSAWTVVQGPRSARMLPGDSVLIDSRQRYEFHFPLSADSVSIELPRTWVDRWLVDAGRHVGCRIDGGAGWGQVLGSFLRELTAEAAVAPPLPPGLLTDQLGCLLALATGGGAPARVSGPASNALCQRVRNAIDERHAEPGLTAGAVAAGIGSSERSLHRCLAQAGLGFARLLLERRMAAARRLLAEPRFDRLSVGEIGRRVGLCDASHFIRLCRRELGATPGSLRRSR